MDSFWCSVCRATRFAEQHWLFWPVCEDCGTQLENNVPSYEVDYKEVLDTSLKEDEEEEDKAQNAADDSESDE